jgi:hypothetical protein
VIAVEGDPAIKDLSTPPVSFKPEMIDDKVNIEIPGKPYQGWYHLFTRAD